MGHRDTVAGGTLGNRPPGFKADQVGTESVPREAPEQLEQLTLGSAYQAGVVSYIKDVNSPGFRHALIPARFGKDHGTS